MKHDVEAFYGSSFGKDSSILKSTISPYELSTIEISSCCDALIGAFNAKIDKHIRQMEMDGERKEKRIKASKKTSDESKSKKIREVKAETGRGINALHKEKELALSCLTEDPQVSVEKSINYFGRIVEADKIGSLAEIAIVAAATDMLPLVQKLKSVFHIARAYPAEVKKRCDKLKLLAAA